jgi:hypothetical protein
MTCDKCKYWEDNKCTDDQEFFDIETGEAVCRYHRNARHSSVLDYDAIKRELVETLAQLAKEISKWSSFKNNLKNQMRDSNNDGDITYRNILGGILHKMDELEKEA